ncbi:MAG: PadR family transcriptional regulator [Tissierellales bacterium]|jgi:DNA-binding PadR family transcriptional regulator|nr:PadR family transcriptional regulator [Tissierellales bacterium]
MKGKTGRHCPAFILLFLANKKSYGFELLKNFETQLPHSKIDSAAIYRALKNLENNGFVVSEWDTSSSGAAKKYYSITESGYKELEEWKKDIELRCENLNFFLEAYNALDK